MVYPVIAAIFIDHAPAWCILVCVKKSPPHGKVKRRSDGTRISVTIPVGDYSTVLQLAKEKKVSAAWIVRDAVEQYIRQQAEL